MFLMKLKVSVIGTSRSRLLDVNEEHTFELPTWFPNPSMNLFTANDYQAYLIEGAAQSSGDRILSVEVFRAEVPDDIDKELAMTDDSIDWIYKGDLVADNIQAIYEEERISGGIDEVAQHIYENYLEWFGWGNGDPSDALEDIRRHLVGLVP